jgi:hypothetical protein
MGGIIAIAQLCPSNTQAMSQGEKGRRNHIIMPRNEYTRCHFISEQGVECDKWFLVDGGKFCPQLHRNMPLQDKDKFMTLVNDERAYSYKLSPEELENHIQEMTARMEEEMQVHKTRIAAARAVKAENWEKMTEEERKELRKIQISKQEGPNGRPKAKQKTDKAVEMSNKLGVNMQDLLKMNMSDLMAKYGKAQSEREEKKDDNPGSTDGPEKQGS